METKRVLFIVEGPSDRISLEVPLLNAVRKKGEDMRLYFLVAGGDLTAKGKTPARSRDLIKKEVASFLLTTMLKPSDIDLIVLLTDLDASFAPRDCYLFDPAVASQTYVPEEKVILLEEPEGLYVQRTRKRECLEYLSRLGTLYVKRYKIPFFVLFSSINLEHSLYGDPNPLSREKVRLSRKFEERFAENHDEFVAFLLGLLGDESSYLGSWETSKRIRRAFERESTLGFLFAKRAL